ncbi:MAG TPA: glycosyltransferase family 2 protein [Patescibacteria group bacterium]|nr:glycosyltransferase family 2 protein [Patescibacteria group bacterium]
MKLSILVPVFNEEKTVTKVLSELKKLKIRGVKLEVIVVDDGSTDKTWPKISKEKLGSSFKFIKHPKNLGKGAAVATAISKASGDYIIIQDADLEYDPKFIPILVDNVQGDRDVIYGTRLNRLPNFRKEERRVRFVLHYLGNRFLSFITSFLYGQWITDMETCYKLIPRKELKKIKLHARRFDFEPEITSKLLKKGLIIKEVPIATNPRGYEEGKKLNTVSDGAAALWTLLKYRFID